MNPDRPWYREPETFIAVAALIVSVSAVVVGIYEAELQRAHDRAEVWPRIEVSTYTMPKGAALYLDNNGIGPAIIKSVSVRVDGRARTSWPDALEALLAHKVSMFESSSVVERAIRAGERVTMVAISASDVPTPFWPTVARVSVSVCYASVYGEQWMVTDAKLGGSSVWTSVKECPKQAPGEDF